LFGFHSIIAVSGPPIIESLCFRGYTVIFTNILPVRLAFDAIEEVEPEVTAAAAAAIEVDVGKAVMDDAAEDDPGIQKSRKNSLN
jgi:hypothetical protein